MDLEDLEHNARDGLHIASLGRHLDRAGERLRRHARPRRASLSFAPRLPDGLTRLAFAIRYRGHCLRVQVTTHEATYSLGDGAAGPLRIAHHGEVLTLTGANPVVRPIPPAPAREPPMQPLGREPQRRSPG